MTSGTRRPLASTGGTTTARLLLAGATACALAGCSGATGDFEPSIGTNARSASTDALGFAVVTNGRGSARIVGTLINKTGNVDYIESIDIETERDARVSVTLSRRTVALRPSEPIQLAKRGLAAVSASDLPSGRMVELTLELRYGEPLEWPVPVEPRRGAYAEVEVTSPPDGTLAPS